MTSVAVSQQLPTVSGQEAPGLRYEEPLKKERIEVAFGEAPDFTESLAKAPTVSTPRPIIPRGLRFARPNLGNNLMGFVTERRWQGYVTDTDAERFRAVVYDTTAGFEDEVEEVEFEREEVAELMRPLIVEGAIFFWDIGFEVETSGQRNRRSMISFPMIPVHTANQLAETRRRASERFRELGWADNDAERAEHAPEGR